MLDFLFCWQWSQKAQLNSKHLIALINLTAALTILHTLKRHAYIEIKSTLWLRELRAPRSTISTHFLWCDAPIDSQSVWCTPAKNTNHPQKCNSYHSLRAHTIIWFECAHNEPIFSHFSVGKIAACNPNQKRRLARCTHSRVMCSAAGCLPVML